MLLLLLGHLSLCVAGVKGEFSFSKFLEGNWTIHRTIGNVHGNNNNDIQGDALMRWVVSKEHEGTVDLVGVDEEEVISTGERLRTRSININFDDKAGNRGVFSMTSSVGNGGDDDDDDADDEDEFEDVVMKPWFDFDFTSSLISISTTTESAQGSGETDGIAPSSSHISHGKCGKPFPAGFCQLIVYGQNKFVLTVFPPNESDVTVLAGSRIISERGLLAQYLPQIGLGAIILVNVFIQSRSQAVQKTMGKKPGVVTTNGKAGIESKKGK